MLILTWLLSAPALGEVLLLIKASNTKRKKLVIGNWKMHGNRQFNAALLSDILAKWNIESQVEAVICPPYPYFQQVLELISNTPLMLGAQSVSGHENGAFTGEISGAMLSDWQCHYVIVGHNERRRLHYETDADVAQKFLAVQRAGLTPVLCVGESLEQRESGHALQIIDAQLDHVVKAAGIDAFKNAVVAYEPVWAVGTGKTATPEQAQQVHAFIRGRLSGVSSRILYGGSVKAHNASQLFQMPDIDGALLGGASLVAEEFIAICNAAN